MKQIDILMRVQAYDAAEEIYKYGKHANTNLLELATSPSSGMVPESDLFQKYFDSETYAHELAHGALNGTTEGITEAQRRIMALRFSQVIIMEHAALDSLFQSASICGNDTETMLVDPVEIWDKGAALLLGSISRPDLSYSTDWYAPYDLAQNHCQQFGTCSSEDQAQVNEKMVELLYAGRGALATASCSGVRKIAEDVQSLLLVPIIQAFLSSTMKLSSSKRTMRDTTEAYISSRALLPLIQAADRSIASTIEKSIGLQHHKVAVQPILDSLHSVYDAMNVDCELIGSSGEYHACANMGMRDDSKSSVGLIVGIVLVSVAVVLCGAVGILFFKRRRQSRSRTQLSRDIGTDMFSASEAALLGFRVKSTPLSSRAEHMLQKIKTYDDDDGIFLEEGLALQGGFTLAEKKPKKPKMMERPFQDEPDYDGDDKSYETRESDSSEESSGSEESKSSDESSSDESSSDESNSDEGSSDESSDESQMLSSIEELSEYSEEFSEFSSVRTEIV